MFNNRLPAILLLALALTTPAAFAHPMGNFSVNHYSKISFESNGIKIQYIIDLAEIPTYQELQQNQLNPTTDDKRVGSFLAFRGESLKRGLSVAVDAKPLALNLVSKEVIFPAGAGGLATMKMGFVYRAAYPAGTDHGSSSLRYSDGNFVGHAGWKEIVVSAPSGFLINSTAPKTDRSSELSNYPTDPLNSPPQDLEASVDFRRPTTSGPMRSSGTSSAMRTAHAVGVPSHTAGQIQRQPASRQASRTKSGEVRTALAPQAAPVEPIHLKGNRQATPRNSFTELMTTGPLSVWFLVTAALIALGLGALHALEPGHGKTIVAAYLVGSHGTARHALLLGLIVTASHTAGVFALGGATLYASRYIVPEQLYPWLGVLSGLTIAGMGGYMFLRRWSGDEGEHVHTGIELHGHWFSSKIKRREGDSAGQAYSRVNGRTVSLWQLSTLGVTGGMIPCPAALVVLLSALTLHRVVLGLFLIVAFSLGLAAVLIGFGMLMVYARRFMTRLQIDGPLTKRWLPVASAVFMTILGAAVAIPAFAATGIGFHTLSGQKLGPILFVAGLGLILGMRHSTDPDHVVAVSTIVSKQRSIRHAAMIGTVWGFGHTLTIFIVGSMIILFGVVIPPRVGLSMEFSVALMLILLGVLNLTGVMQKITSFFEVRDRVENAASRRSILRLPTPTTGILARFGVYQCVRPLVIGIVHGLAGSAAVALLVLSTIHSPLWATLYLLIFGIGTMAGMMCMTAAMAVPLAYCGNRFTQVSQYLGVASGLVSVCFGTFLVYQLGFLGGLFTNHPKWTPQ
jgi:high-affinity nickel-transport protein